MDKGIIKVERKQVQRWIRRSAMHHLKRDTNQQHILSSKIRGIPLKRIVVLTLNNNRITILKITTILRISHSRNQTKASNKKIVTLEHRMQVH